MALGPLAPRTNGRRIPQTGPLKTEMAGRMFLRATGRIQPRAPVPAGLRHVVRRACFAPAAAPRSPFGCTRGLATAATSVVDEPDKEEPHATSGLITPRTRQVSATESHEVALAQTGWRQTMLKLTGCVRSLIQCAASTHRKMRRPAAAATLSRAVVFCCARRYYSEGSVQMRVSRIL